MLTVTTLWVLKRSTRRPVNGMASSDPSPPPIKASPNSPVVASTASRIAGMRAKV